MTPEEFVDKANEAAILHNMGVINRRTGKFKEAIRCFEDGLDLYNECIVHHNSLKGMTEEAAPGDERDRDNYKSVGKNVGMSSGAGTTPICLELKIAQTLQSMARLYTKSLDDPYSAIKAHEDAITLLVEGKFLQDDIEDAVDAYNRQIVGPVAHNAFVYESPKRQERISRHYNIYNEYNSDHNNKKQHHVVRTPTTVITEYDTNTPSPTSRNKKHDIIPDISEYNVVKLKRHERARVITTSLNSLAKIYAAEEESHRKQEQTTNLENKIESEENSISEDPLRYHQTAINFLHEVPNYASTTSIPALSDNCKTLNTASDASLNINALTPSLTIDLRKDISATLMSMGNLHLARGHLSCAMEMFEKALEVREEMCNNDETNNEYLESLHALASTYEKCNQFEKAMPCFQQILKIRKQTHGPESMVVGNLYCNMSNVLRKTNNLAESLSLNKRGIAIYKKNKDCCEEIGDIENDCEDNEKSLKYSICKCIIGALKNQGGLYMQMEEVNQAIESYEEVKHIQVLLDLQNHPDFANTLIILGDLYSTNKNLERAKSNFCDALKLYKQFGIGGNDPDLILTLKSIEEITLEMKKMSSSHETKPSTKVNSPKKKTNDHNIKGMEIGIDLQQQENRHTNNLNEEREVPHYPSIIASQSDDLVSNITFLTKREESDTNIDVREPCSDNWDAKDFVYEGVLTMRNAIGNLAAVTEDFLSELPSVQNLTDKKPVFILSSNFETETGDVCTIFDNVGNIDKSCKKPCTNTPEEEELSTVLGSYALKRQSIVASAEAEDDSTLLGTAFLGNSSNSVLTDQDEVSSAFLRTQPFVRSSSTNQDSSTLIGTSFVNSVTTESKNDSVKDDASSLFGCTFEQSTLSPSKDGIKRQESFNASPFLGIDVSGQNMDELLAKMNVVTNDMDDGQTAKPFKDLPQVETYYYDSSPDYSVNRRKNFEKLSNCLDTLEELEETYGSGHIKCLETLITLADIYLNNGDKTKCINTMMKVADIQSRKYGENHIEVANTHTKIAELWTSKGEHESAIENYSKVKEVEDFLYGHEDPRIALTLNKLGLSELARGDFDMAMDYFQEALRIQRIHLAPNEINPDLSLTLVHIGSVYYKERNSFNKLKDGADDTYKSFIESGMLGKIAFAHHERGEYVRATHFYEELLQLFKYRGKFHHGEVTTLNNLGTLSVKLGRYIEAMVYHEQALMLIKNSCNFSEIDVYETKCYIGIVEYKSGNFKKAINIFENAKIIQEKLLGADHPMFAKSLFHLGVIQRILYQHEEAMSNLQTALQIQMQSLPSHHADTMNTQMEIGIAKLKAFQLDEALEDLKALLKSQIYLLGEVHPETALTHHYMGICYAKKGQISNASKKLDVSYRMRQKINVECPQVASLLDDMGSIHLRKSKLEKASIVFQDSLRIRMDYLSEDHYEISFAIYNLGQLSIEKREFSQALLHFKDSMRIATQTFGLNHPFIGDIHRSVGHVHQRRCQFEEAKSEISLALRIYEAAKLSSSHERIIGAKNDLARVEHEELLCV